MLLLSIQPRYVDAILDGSKQFELRRRKPKAESGPALIYSSAPRMELVASFQIASVTRAPLGLLWQLVRESAGVSRREFDTYFHGLESGVAIEIEDVARLRQPVPLCDLRSAWRGFHPPQSFRYINQTDLDKLTKPARRAA